MDVFFNFIFLREEMQAVDTLHFVIDGACEFTFVFFVETLKTVWVDEGGSVINVFVWDHKMEQPCEQAQYFGNFHCLPFSVHKQSFIIPFHLCCKFIFCFSVGIWPMSWRTSFCHILNMRL